MRKRQIQKQKIGMTAVNQKESLLRRTRGHHIIAGRFDTGRQRIRHLPVVLDDQDFRPRRGHLSIRSVLIIPQHRSIRQAADSAMSEICQVCVRRRSDSLQEDRWTPEGFHGEHKTSYRFCWLRPPPLSHRPGVRPAESISLNAPDHAADRLHEERQRERLTCR